MNEKPILGIITLIIAIVIIAFLFILQNPQNEGILLEDGATLNQDKCSQLNKVTIIHAAGCSACAIAIPRLQELEQELEMNFDYYDFAIDNDKEKILNFGLIPKAVPTAIINCKVYVGAKSKEQYKEAILGE